MPIYAYKCSNCNFEKDYIEKHTDSEKTECPNCKKETFKRVLTAPGAFQLKGAGFYRSY